MSASYTTDNKLVALLYACVELFTAVSSLSIQCIRLVTERWQLRLSSSPLQATLSKLLTYCVLKSTQPPTLSVTEISSTSHNRVKPVDSDKLPSAFCP